jgi:hypothetical protein
MVGLVEWKTFASSGSEPCVGAEVGGGATVLGCASAEAVARDGLVVSSSPAPKQSVTVVALVPDRIRAVEVDGVPVLAVDNVARTERPVRPSRLTLVGEDGSRTSRSLRDEVSQ